MVANGPAKAALAIARQWASQSVTNIIITNRAVESYGLDYFGMVAGSKEDKPDADRT
jgi:hypothetical protein